MTFLSSDELRYSNALKALRYNLHNILDWDVETYFHSGRTFLSFIALYGKGN